MKWIFPLLTILLPLTLFSQGPRTNISSTKGNNVFAQVDARALQMPDSLSHDLEGIGNFINSHFQTPKEKSRAIFVWITNNIQYDVANMFAINFYEDSASKILKALQTRRGICENYASLFSAICQKVGIESVVVEGYTKQRGFVDYIPHAWNAAMINGTWYLFDPTWGSGYVSNGKFVKSMNESYFMASPENFVKSHMPFDYLWQFLYYPLTNQEFYEENFTQNKSKPYFNYPDSIRVYNALSSIEKNNAQAIRVEKNGVKNSLIFDRLRNLKADIENYRRQKEVDNYNEKVSTYNSALRDFNIGIKLLNTFINYRNDQFKPSKSNAEIQHMIDTADFQIRLARQQVDSIHLEDSNAQLASLIPPMKQSIDEAMTKVKEQKEWLATYFTKSKMGRKSMFYKVTFFGKPVN
ncbi:MAG: hypothetical protein C5B59_12645 [Bacteroidetes bacterium]|nr:MAG: hypothetical protein C5B59_12645 [Bacteroidota bacterium]